MLNIGYKIIVKVFADRLTKIMPFIISSDQTCCIPDRDITDNVMALRDLVDYISEQELSGYDQD